ncbi:MAG: type VI secretion system-associated FHA domain protein TagH [Steroidobacteraceae bacterium]
MALKLRVISEHYQQLGKQSSRLFGVTGGRIGRSADNDWILPDPERYVSSHHAEVRFESGKWILEDVSTNGIFVNGSDTPLSQQGVHQMKDGDRLRLGDYDILVSIDEQSDFPPEATGQAPQVSVAKAKGKSRTEQRAELEELNVEIDINELLSSTAPEPNVAASDPFEIGNAYGMGVARSSTARAGVPTTGNAAEKYEDIPLTAPPALSREAGIDWHLKTRRLQNDSKPVERPRGVDGHGELSAALEAFCRGAGVDPASIATETQATMLTLAGQMLREVVLGMMEALKARGEIKSRMDAGNTPMQAMDNNPLKVATSVDDAMRKLLDTQNSRYLGPVESLREGFADLRSHQQAMIAAMHAALNGTMNRVDPGELQERFDRSLNRGTLMGAANKLKYWDMYAEFFQVLNQRNSDGLPISFAEDFARTYGERLAGFKNPRKK